VLTSEKLVECLRKAGKFVSDSSLYTNEEGLAYLLECSVPTVKNWRKAGRGPRAQYTTRVVFSIDEIARWWNHDSGVPWKRR
jgi:hypothetical protein